MRIWISSELTIGAFDCIHFWQYVLWAGEQTQQHSPCYRTVGGGPITHISPLILRRSITSCFWKISCLIYDPLHSSLVQSWKGGGQGLPLAFILMEWTAFLFPSPVVEWRGNWVFKVVINQLTGYPKPRRSSTSEGAREMCTCFQ